MSRLKGSRELRSRLKAIKVAFKPYGRKWGRASITAGRPMVPVRTGRLRKSMRILSATEKKTRVGAHYTAYFVDKGPKPHWIRSKSGEPMMFRSRGKVIFARAVHHRGYRGRPFRKRMAKEGLRQVPLAVELVNKWNRAA
jgi:hypothetical protein